MSQPLPMLSSTRLAAPRGGLASPLTACADDATELQRAGPLTGPAVEADGRIVSADSAGRLTAFDTQTLELLWAVDMPDWAPEDRVPLICGDTVVTRRDTDWAVRSLANGELLHQTVGPRMLMMGAMIHGAGLIGTIFRPEPPLGTFGLARFNPATGAQDWTAELRTSASVVPTLVGDVVVQSSVSHWLDAHDARTGAALWSYDVSSIGIRETPFTPPRGVIPGWPLALGGRLVLPIRFDHWLGLDPASGAEVWRTRTGSEMPGRATRVGDDRLVILSDGRVQILEAATGALLADRADSALPPGPWGAGVASASHVFATSVPSGVVVAVSAESGAVEWTSSPGQPTAPDRPPILTDSHLIAMSTDGTVRLFSAG